MRRFIYKLGDFNVSLMLFIPLMLIFFFKFTKPYIRYLNEISSGIHHLANGEFQNQVKIASRDEFSAIAEDLNAAGAKLLAAVQRGISLRAARTSWLSIWPMICVRRSPLCLAIWI